MIIIFFLFSILTFELPNVISADTTPPVFKGVSDIKAIPEVAGLIVYWESATDDSPPITYEIYMATSSGKQNFSHPSYITQNSTNMRIYGLKPETDYYIVVRAVDSLGNRENNTVEKHAKTSTAVPFPSNNNGINIIIIFTIIVIIFIITIVYLYLRKKKNR